MGRGGEVSGIVRIKSHDPRYLSAAGAKEAELQGASSVVRGNAVVEGMQGET